MSISISVMPVTDSVRKYQSSGEHMKVTRHTCSRNSAAQKHRSHICSSSSASTVYGVSDSSPTLRVAAPNMAAAAEAVTYRTEALKSSTSTSISRVVTLRRFVVYMANVGSSRYAISASIIGSCASVNPHDSPRSASSVGRRVIRPGPGARIFVAGAGAREEMGSKFVSRRFVGDPYKGPRAHGLPTAHDAQERRAIRKRPTTPVRDGGVRRPSAHQDAAPQRAAEAGAAAPPGCRPGAQRGPSLGLRGPERRRPVGRHDAGAHRRRSVGPGPPVLKCELMGCA